MKINFLIDSSVCTYVLCFVQSSLTFGFLTARLSSQAKEDDAVKHALAVSSAVSSGNYVQFFRLYKAAPNLSTSLMGLWLLAH